MGNDTAARRHARTGQIERTTSSAGRFSSVSGGGGGGMLEFHDIDSMLVKWNRSILRLVESSPVVA